MTDPAGAARWVVAAAWAAMLVSLLRRGLARGRPGGEVRRDPASLAGLALEAAAFAAVFARRDAAHALPSAAPAPLAWAVVAFAAVLLAASALLADRSLAVLGAQWRVVASVGSEDRLVTEGPFARVRHPVYAAMLGALLGTGVLLSGPVTWASAAAAYLAGTAIRIRSEERLLRARFGAAHEAYARKVPALLPLRRRPAASGREGDLSPGSAPPRAGRRGAPR